MRRPKFADPTPHGPNPPLKPSELVLANNMELGSLVLGARKKTEEKNVETNSTGLSWDFLGILVHVEFPPPAMTPKTHEHIFATHPVPEQSPKFVYVYVFFSFPASGSDGLGPPVALDPIASSNRIAFFMYHAPIALYPPDRPYRTPPYPSFPFFFLKKARKTTPKKEKALLSLPNPQDPWKRRRHPEPWSAPPQNHGPENPRLGIRL